MEITPFRLQFTQPIRGLIARHVLGLATEKDIVDCAHGLLNAGYYARSLGEIITAYGENSFELNDRFEKMFTELELSSPTQNVAICELEAGYWISISEYAEPAAVSSRAFFDRNAMGYETYLANSRGEIDWNSFEKLLDYYWRYDYPEKHREESNAVIDEECIAFATEWTRKYWKLILNISWLTPTVQSIAAAIDQDRAFDRLPILADALEEAGCTNADVLLHCRQPGEHVRGCWVVDLVLGKK